VILLAIAMLSAALPMRVVDHDSGAPIAAHVVAWEHYHWTGFHSSGDTCFRAAAARIEPSGGTVVLPFSLATMWDIGSNPRRIESLTFESGYCAVRPYAPEPNGMRPGDAATIRLRASNDAPERRLLYLREVASELTGICDNLKDRRFVEAMSAQILAEAQSLPRTFHERFLLQRIRETLLGTSERSFVFNPLVNVMTMSQGDVGKLREVLAWTRASPMFEGPSWQRPKHMFGPHEPFQIDLRADDGQTALMKAAGAVNLPAMQFLLEQGASSHILTQPGGLGALDVLLLRAERDVNVHAPNGVEVHLLRAVDVLLAANATLHAANLRLLSHPQEWKLDARAREFWTLAAGKMVSIPGRTEVIPACTARAIEPQTLRLGAPPR
jgi:hypothetical protein